MKCGLITEADSLCRKDWHILLVKQAQAKLSLTLVRILAGCEIRLERYSPQERWTCNVFLKLRE